MDISADIPLILGAAAGILFISIFLWASCIVCRNRRRIKECSSSGQGAQEGRTITEAPAAAD